MVRIGDEFAVLTPQTGAEAAVVVAERLRALVAKAGNGRRSRGTTISIGIASVSPSMDALPTAATLMVAADTALYAAKRGGGNRVSTGGSKD